MVGRNDSLAKQHRVCERRVVAGIAQTLKSFDGAKTRESPGTN